jgi:propionate catabolism operon transcriptional regulator
VAAELLRRALLRHGAPEAHRRALELVLPRLEGYAWPGNVRELENVLERVAVLFADRPSADAIDAEEVRAAMPEVFERRTPADGGLRSTREAHERAHVRRVLDACGGDAAEAARRLGIGRSTLYRKLGGRR